MLGTARGERTVNQFAFNVMCVIPQPHSPIRFHSQNAHSKPNPGSVLGERWLHEIVSRPRERIPRCGCGGTRFPLIFDTFLVNNLRTFLLFSISKSSDWCGETSSSTKWYTHECQILTRIAVKYYTLLDEISQFSPVQWSQDVLLSVRQIGQVFVSWNKR